eukprot:9482628-Pyramimonas_sp.AAC.1
MAPEYAQEAPTTQDSFQDTSCAPKSFRRGPQGGRDPLSGRNRPLCWRGNVADQHNKNRDGRQVGSNYEGGRRQDDFATRSMD